MSHTPGTWEVSKHATPDYAPQFGVYAEGEQHDLAIVKGINAEADACLIAAAPKLLEACQEALFYLEACVEEQGADDPDDSAWLVPLLTEAITSAGGEVLK